MHTHIHPHPPTHTHTHTPHTAPIQTCPGAGAWPGCGAWRPAGWPPAPERCPSSDRPAGRYGTPGAGDAPRPETMTDRKLITGLHLGYFIVLLGKLLTKMATGLNLGTSCWSCFR